MVCFIGPLLAPSIIDVVPQKQSLIRGFSFKIYKVSILRRRSKKSGQGRRELLRENIVSSGDWFQPDLTGRLQSTNHPIKLVTLEVRRLASCALLSFRQWLRTVLGEWCMTFQVTWKPSSQVIFQRWAAMRAVGSYHSWQLGHGYVSGIKRILAGQCSICCDHTSELGYYQLLPLL